MHEIQQHKGNRVMQRYSKVCVFVPWRHEGHELLSRRPVLQSVHHRFSILGLGPLWTGEKTQVRLNNNCWSIVSSNNPNKNSDPSIGELTGDVLKSIPELLDPRVGHHLVFTVEEVSLMVCKLLVEGVSLPQTGVEPLMDSWHQHRLHNTKPIR